MHEAYGRNVSVVNTGLSGDTAAVPPNAPLTPPYFQERLNRDVINVAGVTDVILYDGPNDYGSYGILAPATIAAYQTFVSKYPNPYFDSIKNSLSGDPDIIHDLEIEAKTID